VHSAIILGSLAKGTEANVKSLLDYGVLEVMLLGLQQSDLRYVHAETSCLSRPVLLNRVHGSPQGE